MNNDNKKSNGGKIAIIIVCVVLALLFLGFLLFIGIIILGALGITLFAVNYISNIGQVVGNVEELNYSYHEHVVTSYEEYQEYFGEYGFKSLTEVNFEKSNFYIFPIKTNNCGTPDFKVNNIAFTSNNLNGVYDTLDVGLTYTQSCGVCPESYTYYAIELGKDVKRIKEFNYKLDARSRRDCGNAEYKPMIYIYPEEDINVEVKLGNSDLITTSYPKYEKVWNVFAKTNGDLEYNGRTYYGLYWEGANHTAKVEKDGFVIKGEDTSKFLEEKLEILGLNEKEANEFIIYWLPKMEHNNYNYIRFETREEIDNYMPLEVTPVPDTTIRVYMNFKALDEEIEVEEQKLEKVTRSGYSVIEWGGSIIE